MWSSSKLNCSYTYRMSSTLTVLYSCCRSRRHSSVFWGTLGFYERAAGKKGRRQAWYGGAARCRVKAKLLWGHHRHLASALNFTLFLGQALQPKWCILPAAALPQTAIYTVAASRAPYLPAGV